MQREAPSLEALESLPASHAKKPGWPSVVRTVRRERVVVMTNHDEPEVVMMTPEEYVRIAEIVNRARIKADEELVALRERFDARLASLQDPGASDRLRAAARAPVRLEGAPRAGSSY